MSTSLQQQLISQPGGQPLLPVASQQQLIQTPQVGAEEGDHSAGEGEQPEADTFCLLEVPVSLACLARNAIAILLSSR